MFHCQITWANFLKNHNHKNSAGIHKKSRQQKTIQKIGSPW